MPQAPDTRERSDSTELVLYDPWCGLLPRHPLLSSYFLTLAVEPRVVTDCVPIVHSYMQPLQLLKSACVCKDWTEIAARDCYWERLVRRDYAVDADDRRSRVHGPVRDATLKSPAPHCTINNAAKPLHNLSSDDGVGRASTNKHAMFDAHIVTDAADQSSAPISSPVTG